MMASQGNALPEVTAEDWCGVLTPNEVNQDTHITELLERLIDEAGLEDMSVVERTYDAQIAYELTNIPPEMLLPYDGEMLGDDDDEQFEPPVNVRKCDTCGKIYENEKSLTRHKREIHEKSRRFICGNCGHCFTRRHTLESHNKICGGGGSAKRKEEGNKENAPPPKKQRTEDQVGGGEVGQGVEENVEEETDEKVKEESAIEENLKVYKMTPNKNEKYDLSLTLQRKKRAAVNNLKKELAKKRGIKWFLCVQVRMVKNNPDGEEYASPHFRSHTQIALTPDQFEMQYGEAVEKIKTSFLEYQREGSGWQLDQVLHLTVSMATYTPLSGSSYLPLPKALKDKKALLNIQNDDDKCFTWSVLAAKHPVQRQDNANRISHYERYEGELNMAGIDYPVKISQVKKFVRQNSGVSVNVFGYEDKELFPLYITKDKKNLHVNLLLFSKDDKQHYCLIRDLSRLLNNLTKHEHRRFHCNYCLHGFIRQNLLDDHEPLCSKHGPQKIKLPDEENNVLRYNQVQKQLRVPFVIYADFESILVPCEQENLDPSLSYTKKVQLHEPCGFCYTVVSVVEEYCKPPVVYRGADAVDKFLECLVADEQVISEVLKHVEPMVISPEQEQAFQEADLCHICKLDLGADRVRDHDHLTGKYRGAAHNECNLNFKFTGKIPVVLHNLRGYDSHLIMQGLGKLKDRKITCIPNNTEKYISFSVGDLEFIDSLQFMNAFLEGLVSNLAKEGDVKFRVLKKYTSQDKVPYLLRKGVYPYEYMTSFQRFEETSLPPREAFFSTLRGEGISEADYDHASEVFRRFNCQSLGDYHDLYLKSDVLLLADVFENFRDICLEYYELDPCHFYTSPGLSWQACLKMTGVELELLTDPDMHLFIEEGMRGGISTITHRYAKANNPYIQGHDPDQEANYIMYLDANNLYGWAMSQHLPTGNFGWLSDQEIEYLDVMTIPDDGVEGYILEVDLEYPKELHDVHNDYPLAPEKLKVSADMLSHYCTRLIEDLNMTNTTTVTKLVPNLNDKSHYVIHYRNLKQYLSLGLSLTKIHKVLGFDQSPWLRSYIDFNTEKRKLATNDFEKDLFKLLNNAVFGKTMENLHKRVNVKLVNNPKQLNKLTASPLFDYFRIFSEDLAAVNMRKPTLYLNRPTYVGFCILDLSKTLMYDFHYNYIKQTYGENATLLFTDTDSLCYDIRTQDIYRDMGCDINLFDTSGYDRDHFLYSTVNKKVLGKMKDECHGIPIREFVGLRPKMYSLLYVEGGKTIEKKTAKGISKYVTKRDIKHQNYKECLFEKKRQMANMNRIQSFKHHLYSVNLNKIGLSPYDDKRYILDDGVTTLAHGHHNINRL